jgi:DNA recombination protein RmuC
MSFDPQIMPLLVIAAFAAALFAAAGCVFAVLAFLAARRAAGTQALSRDDVAGLLRVETDYIRNAVDGSARGLRQETGALLGQQNAATQAAVKGLSDSLLQRTDAFSQLVSQMVTTAEAQHSQLRSLTESRFDQFAAAEAETARNLREELNASFQRMRSGVTDMLTQSSDHQKERLEATQRELKALGEISKQGGDQLRASVEARLDALRAENTAKLEEVRVTVDEKLQTTLEARLGESFNRVVEQLNKAYEVFGEMKNISTSVGDLKNVLTNPKLRGTFGEVQLSMLLQDFLSPSQYVKDAQVKEHSGERVEFAIRVPSADGEDVLLPVDAKFPREDHEHMIAAHERGDQAAADHHRKQLENRIKSFAKDISRKYINPPRTTERAILFLPTESLFAEVLRQPGLFDFVQRECNVMLAGPTTFAAILHSFQINHRSMAIAQRSGEIWQTLSAVRTEFTKYNAAVEKVAKQLRTAAGSVDDLQTRTKMMDRALKKVEVMPEEGAAAKLLGLDALDTDAEDEAAEPIALLPAARAAS